MSLKMIPCHGPHGDSLSLLWTRLSHIFSIYPLRNLLGGFNNLVTTDLRCFVEIHCGFGLIFCFGWLYFKSLTASFCAFPSIDKPKALSLLLHTADISHPAKNWDLHHHWTTSLLEEFFRQVRRLFRAGKRAASQVNAWSRDQFRKTDVRWVM